MEIKTRHLVNREQKEITLLLYGEIGNEIDGNYFAQELNYIDQIYDTVVVRINSEGGSVAQGLSIVSQLLLMKAYTIAQIDGVAASMAAVIPVACDEVRMNDYARIMIHSPYFIDDAGKKVQVSDKDKKAAESIRGILVDLLTKRGKTSEEVLTLMTNETWFTADEALAAGLIHAVITTGRPELLTISTSKLVACINNDSIFQNSQKSMKQICAKLGLPETSSEAAVLNVLQERDTLAATNAAKLVDSYLEFGRKSGAVNDLNIEKMTRLAKADFELFVDMVLEKPAVMAIPRVSALLVNNGSAAVVAKSDHDWDWYQKNDAQALAAMEYREPERFVKLLAAYNSQFI